MRGVGKMVAAVGSLIPAAPGAENQSIADLVGSDLSPRSKEIRERNLALIKMLREKGDGHSENLVGDREEPPKRIRSSPKRIRGSPSGSNSPGSDQSPVPKRQFEDQTGEMLDDVPPLSLAGENSALMQRMMDHLGQPPQDPSRLVDQPPMIDREKLQKGLANFKKGWESDASSGIFESPRAFTPPPYSSEPNTPRLGPEIKPMGPPPPRATSSTTDLGRIEPENRPTFGDQSEIEPDWYPPGDLHPIQCILGLKSKKSMIRLRHWIKKILKTMKIPWRGDR